MAWYNYITHYRIVLKDFLTLSQKIYDAQKKNKVNNKRHPNNTLSSLTIEILLLTANVYRYSFFSKRKVGIVTDCNIYIYIGDEISDHRPWWTCDDFSNERSNYVFLIIQVYEFILPWKPDGTLRDYWTEIILIHRRTKQGYQSFNNLNTIII